MLSGKLLPIHFKPQPDELLSSWLVRLSVAHGAKPQMFWNVVLGRNDFWCSPKKDQLNDEELLATISGKTGTSFERVLSTTLAMYSGYLYEKSLTHGFSTWVMPQGNVYCYKTKSYGMESFGLQYCPSCLSEDEEPFFRRRWRLSFVVFCERHKVLLLDRCAHCGRAANYHLNASREPFRGRRSLTRCHNCAHDLREVDNAILHPVKDPRGIVFQESLLNTLGQGWAEVPGSDYVHSYLYFYGLYCLMSGLLRNLNQINKFPERLTQCYEIKENIYIPRQGVNPFERLNPATRSQLLTLLQNLLVDWPNCFVDFCKENRLWGGHWKRSREFVPFWCSSAIKEHLDQTKYRPSEQEIDAAINYIRKTGGVPNTRALTEYFHEGICFHIMRRRNLNFRLKNKFSGECPKCHATAHQYKYGLTKRDGHPKIKCYECNFKYTVGVIQRGVPMKVRLKAVQLYAEGIGPKSISERLSVSTASIYKWIKIYPAL